ncbi:MAG: phosphotransferase [Pseudomonadota bacterium]
MSTLPQTIAPTAAIEQLRADWDREHIQDIQYLPGGYSNANYVFTYLQDRFVLRIPFWRQPFTDYAEEANWYHKLRSQDDLIGPTPIAIDENTGCMITPWVEGELLIDYAQDTDPASLIDELATYLTNLHRHMPRSNRHYQLNALTQIYVPESTFTATPTRAVQTCHNDLNPWNVIVNSQGWHTLDWEVVGQHDPLFDLVNLHQGLGLPDELLENFVRAYAPALVDDEHRLAVNLRNYWIREWAWATYQIEHGNDRPEILEQASDSAQRLAQLESSPCP